MPLLSSVAPEALAYFTWLHAMALPVALIGGIFAFAGYFSRDYDGDKIMPNWEWRRGTGHGVRMRNATIAEVYAHNNKGRSYRASWKHTGVVLCVFGALFIWFIALIYPMIVLDPSVMGNAGYAWSAGWTVFNYGVPNPLSEVIQRPAFLPGLIVTLLATVVGFRMGCGVNRLISLLRRRKSGKPEDRLTRAEQACMGLSRADFFISMAGILALIYPIVRALQCVFAPGAAGMDALPGDYHNGMLPLWQFGVSAAYLLWAVVHSLVRTAISRKHPR